MAEISRVALYGKLNTLAYKLMERATASCKMRCNPNVTLEHWLHEVMESGDNDICRIMSYFNMDPWHLGHDIATTLDKLPKNDTVVLDLAPNLDSAVERAWVYSTLLLRLSSIRTGTLLIGLLKTESLRDNLLRTSLEFNKINLETLTDRFASITFDPRKAP